MRDQKKRGYYNYALIISAALLALLPLYVHVSGDDFYLDLANRLMILAIAATSLNLILGHGGMISFGHAAYLGIGAYSIGIPAYYEIYDGLFQLLVAITVSGLFALLTGAVCLRTKGVYFIMITMAFTQMAFFGIVSIEEYGGDDGLVIDTRSSFGKLYCYSFATAFFIYVAVNMGMVLGLLPIVGAPLPIMSYGGSSMMAIMLGLGIAMSCRIYKDTPVN